MAASEGSLSERGQKVKCILSVAKGPKRRADCVCVCVCKLCVCKLCVCVDYKRVCCVWQLAQVPAAKTKDKKKELYKGKHTHSKHTRAHCTHTHTLDTVTHTHIHSLQSHTYTSYTLQQKKAAKALKFSSFFYFLNKCQQMFPFSLFPSALPLLARKN